MKMPKKGRDQRKLVSNVDYQSSLDFAPKHRVAEEQNWTRGGAICQDFLMLKLGCELKLNGLARTQIPTNKNDDVEFPTFGEIAGVNHSLVQWSSLALEEPPS